MQYRTLTTRKEAANWQVNRIGRLAVQSAGGIIKIAHMIGRHVSVGSGNVVSFGGLIDHYKFQIGLVFLWNDNEIGLIYIEKVLFLFWPFHQCKFREGYAMK